MAVLAGKLGADLAWAVMHALINEPLEAGVGYAPRSFLEIYE